MIRPTTYRTLVLIIQITVNFALALRLKPITEGPFNV